MATSPIEHSDEARAALRVIVAEHGPEALSRPDIMLNLLKDFLPDAPAVARILVSGAEDRIADQLREYVAQGLDVKTATMLVTSSFANSTLIVPETCAWVVGEFALALGLTAGDLAPPHIAGQPTMVASDQVTQVDPGIRTAQTHDFANSGTEGPTAPTAAAPVPGAAPGPDMAALRLQLDQSLRRVGRPKRAMLLAAGALAVLVVVLIVLALQGSHRPQKLTVEQLRTGDCVTGSNLPLGTSGSWPYQVTSVPCTHGHLAQFFFADTAFWPAAAAFPGSGAVIRAGDAKCREAFRAYVGVSTQSSEYSWGSVSPDTLGSWQSGFRLLDCYAYLGGTTLRQSIKGSRK